MNEIRTWDQLDLYMYEYVEFMISLNQYETM